MKRGEAWTVSGGGDFAGQPHPAVIVQDDRFDATDSFTIRAFTTEIRPTRHCSGLLWSRTSAIACVPPAA